MGQFLSIFFTLHTISIHFVFTTLVVNLFFVLKILIHLVCKHWDFFFVFFFFFLVFFYFFFFWLINKCMYFTKLIISTKMFFIRILLNLFVFYFLLSDLYIYDQVHQPLLQVCVLENNSQSNNLKLKNLQLFLMIFNF